jgi:Major Facilitator Superfamily
MRHKHRSEGRESEHQIARHGGIGQALPSGERQEARQGRHYTVGAIHGRTPQEQLEVVLQQDGEGRWGLTLIAQGWGEGIGWYPQKTIALDASQIEPLAWFFLKDDPTDLGLLPDGEPPSADGRQVNPTRAAAGPLQADSWRAALRSWPFWQLSGAYCVCGFTTAVLTTHFIPYAIDRGYTPASAATALGVMNGLNVVGVIVMGALADRWGRKNLLALVYTGRGAAYALLLLAPDPWGLWGFAAIAGFSYWATAPLTTSLTADVYGLKILGTLSGLTFLVHQVGGAASIQFAGLMRDLTGSYTLPFTLAGLLLIPAALSAFSIREHTYSARAQGGPATINAVDTTTTPSPPSPVIAHLKIRS